MQFQKNLGKAFGGSWSHQRIPVSPKNGYALVPLCAHSLPACSHVAWSFITSLDLGDTSVHRLKSLWLEVWEACSHSHQGDRYFFHVLLRVTLFELYQFFSASMFLLICGGSLVSKSCPTVVTLWTVACQAPLTMGFSRQ